MAAFALGFQRKSALSKVALAALVGLLGACRAEGSEPSVSPTPASIASQRAQALASLKELELVKAGELLAEQASRGVGQPAEFATDGSYAFRATCTGGGRITVRTHASRENDVAVACDGFISGMRYLTDLDVEVWTVDATDAQQWAIVWVDWDGVRS